MLNVFALIGPGGTGKTTICRSASQRIHKFKVMYTTEDDLHIDNRLVLSKFCYVDLWFREVFRIRERQIRSCISDRCPYDTAAFVQPADALFAIYQIAIRELEQYGVYVKVIYVRAPLDVIRLRVSDRLITEPWRKRYHEDDGILLERTFNFFETRIDLWDLVINNTGNVYDAAEQLNKFIDKH